MKTLSLVEQLEMFCKLMEPDAEPIIENGECIGYKSKIPSQLIILDLTKEDNKTVRNESKGAKVHDMS